MADFLVFSMADRGHVLWELVYIENSEDSSMDKTPEEAETWELSETGDSWKELMIEMHGEGYYERKRKRNNNREPDNSIFSFDKEVELRSDYLLNEFGLEQKLLIFYVYSLKVKEPSSVVQLYVGRTTQIEQRLAQHIESNLDTTTDIEYDIMEIEELEVHAILETDEEKRRAMMEIKEREMFLEKCEQYGPENVLGGK